MKNLVRLFVMFIAVISQGQTLLKSNFENSELWQQEYGGQWEIKNGISRGKTQSLWAGDKDWENYSFSCRAKCVEGGDEGQIWLSFRYKDEWNRYAIAIRGGLLDDVSLFRYREAGIEEPQVWCHLNIPLGFDFKGGRWYDVKIEANGGNIKVWVGDTDKPQIDYTDSKPITAGAIALGGNYHLCEFDDVIVEALEPLETPSDAAFANTAVKINFAPANVQVDGFKNSDGSQYSSEKGFGWDKDRTASIRQRNSTATPELDTIMTVAHNETQATFTIDLPSGEYYVTAIAGDMGFATYFNATLQDDIFLEDCNINTGITHYAGKYVKITNGKLRLLLNRPAGKAGLSLACLVIEKWGEVSQSKKQKEQNLAKRLEFENAQKRIKEQKRASQRQDYKPVKIKDIEKDNRTAVSLDGKWLFMPDQDITDGAKPYALSESDTSWHILEVPNFWNQIAWWTMELAQFGERGNSMAYRHDEIRRTAEYTFDYGNTQSAWYRQWVEIPQSAKGSKIFVKFDAVASACEIYINGRKAGEHLGMFTPFEIDLTDHVKFGEQNLIAVHVSGGAYKKTADDDKAAGIAITMEITNEMLNSLPKGIYRSQATSDDLHTNRKLSRPNGIWQPVQLIITPKAKLEDVFFKSRLDGAELEITVKNTNTDNFIGEVDISAAGERIKQEVRIPPQKSKVFYVSLDVDNPKLWTPETPNLYELAVRLNEDGKQIDTFNCNVGFRTFEVKGSRYYLNGQPRWLGGGNMPPHGLRPNDKELADKFFKLMHEGNQMITRAVCSPLTPVWADAADRQGVAVSLEGTWPWVGLYDKPMPTGVLLETWINETLDLVRQLRNHPSIVIWTVGNEFNYHPHWHQNEKSPEDVYLGKMKVLSGLVTRIRQLDPTRPICLWSNYKREEYIYEGLLKPNGIDDGDITDPHCYRGWYEPSTFQDECYNGGYLPEYTGQAIMSQEASTGYANDDNGSAERTYTQLYVPQSWIGDEAYEHRDPKYFLDYNAFISKEWMEDVRRTRRTAGWVAFCNTCWFKYSPFVDHIEPYTTYYEMKAALQPVLPSLDQRDRHYYAGSAFKGAVVVVNDDVNCLGYDDIKCIAKLKNSGGKTLTETQISIGKCDYYTNAEAAIEFIIPADCVRTRDNCTLELTLTSKSKILGQNSYELLIANKSWAFDIENVDGIAIVEAEGKIAKKLKGVGVKNISIDNIATQKAVIWANKPLPAKSENNYATLLEYVQNGGILIALETANAQDFVPDGVINDKYKSNIGHAWLSNVEFANIEIPSHKIFDGFTSQDLRWWNGNGSSPEAAKISYVLNTAENISVLAEHVPIHGYGWKGPAGSPMFIVNYGKGKILVSELRTSTSDTDPLAGRMLNNIIKWALGENDPQ